MSIPSPETTPSVADLAAELRGYRRLGAIGNRQPGFADFRRWNVDVPAVAEAVEQAVRDERDRCVAIFRFCIAAEQEELIDQFIENGVSAVETQIRVGVERKGI